MKRLGSNSVACDTVRPIELEVFGTVLLQVVPVVDGLEGARKNGARAGAVGLTDKALALHPIEDGGGAAVADAQPPLEHGGRGALHLAADAQRLVEQFVTLARAALAVRRLLLGLRDGLVVDGRAALRLDVRDNLGDLC